MARVDDIRKGYEEITDRLYNNRQAFSDFLNFSGRFYKLPSVQTMAIFSENPAARMVADYETWGSFDRQVKRGEKGIGYISSGTVKYCFDISQTSGETEPYQWKFDKQTADTYKNRFSEEHDGNFSSLAQCVSYLAVDEVNGSINTIANSLHISAGNKSAFLKSARSMVRQIVKSRCEYRSAYKINTAPLDLSALDMLHSKAEFEKLCEWVQLTAKSALRKMEKTIINEIIVERSIGNGRTQRDMVQGGQQVLRGDDRGERANVQARFGNVDVSSAADGGLQRGGAGTDETADWELRTEVAGVYAGEPPVRDSTVGDESAVRADRTESGQRGEGDVRAADSAVGSGTPTSTDDIHGERGVGENEDNGVQKGSNGGRSSETQRDLSADTIYPHTAEEKSSAFSFSAMSSDNIITAYRVGDFYEFFGENAQLTFELLNLTKTTRQGVPMTGVPAYALEDYKKRLAEKGYIVNIGDERNIKDILNTTSQKADTYSTISVSSEAEQPTLFDIQPEVKAEKKPNTDESENPKLAAAINALKDYARTTILYYNSEIREAFLNSTRSDFDFKVRSAVGEVIGKFSRGDIISELAEKGDFSALYMEMYENGELAENLYTEISDMLYSEHIEINKARQTAHETGLPYDEYPYDPEEDFDPYAYNPDRMSDEDYDRMHELIAKERAEAEKLIDKTVNIKDRDYIVEGVISNGADGFFVKLSSKANDKYNISSVIYEDVDVVREMLENKRIPNAEFFDWTNFEELGCYDVIKKLLPTSEPRTETHSFCTRNPPIYPIIRLK